MLEAHAVLICYSVQHHNKQLQLSRAVKHTVLCLTSNWSYIHLHGANKLWV